MVKVTSVQANEKKNLHDLAKEYHCRNRKIGPTLSTSDFLQHHEISSNNFERLTTRRQGLLLHEGHDGPVVETDLSNKDDSAREISL